jgi:phospholipid/cholesterol/gamma-HCH transport system substrate-binding protein
MSDRFKFRRVNEITGIFVIAIVVLLIGVIVWTARSQRWFKSTVTLRIILPEAGAAGIRQGSEVYFLGTLVGAVSDVLVETTGRMEAHARIRRDFFLFVRSDSSAVVKKKFGVAGDAFFEITRGVGKSLPEQNASIMCHDQFQSGFESAIEEIRSETAAVLKKTGSGLEIWAKLGADLQATRQKLEQVMTRWDTIAAGIESGKGTVGKLIVQPDIADETLEVLASANEAIVESRVMMTNLNLTVKNLQEGTARLPEVGSALANEAKDLPGLVQQTKTSMRELERLILALQRHWLVRKYMDKVNPPVPDSIKHERSPTMKQMKPGRQIEESYGTR